ncbi:exosortase family protein XrtF [Flavobacterium caeni]|uniref:exosortase family protein XrtF n=1 Tax=Flavobacterium caeni TaxID=490189 RepID=UPI00373FDD6F
MLKIAVTEYFVKYKPFLVFLGKFLLTYALLTLVYQAYLGQFSKADFEVDSFTESVAHQTKWLIAVFDNQVATAPHLEQASIKMFYHHRFVARIVEGCNALSVIILFVSFVVAFTGKTKTTIGYIVAGSLLVHVLNIARIAFLVVALYHFPEYEDLLHGVIFPLIIYGVVFILWVIWVNKFSLYAAKPVEK